MAIALRYAARSDVGLVRSSNQDSAYAGPHLLVVADGMGGHAGGDVASSLAIGELAPLDGDSPGSDALDQLSRAVQAAHRELLERVEEEPGLAGMGTTITALLRAGSRLALAHIGDSRAYLLRDGVMVQITKDHTFVQTLVDEGRLTQEEAEHHPQRSVLMRVLSDVVDDVDPDLSMREARIGDRYLLCSDGLSGVVSFETLQDTLDEGHDPGTTCERLVQLALRAGAPDNVTCIIADIIDDASRGDTNPYVVGAASLHQPRRGLNGSPGSPAERAAALMGGDDSDQEASHDRPAHRGRRVRLAVGGVVVLLVLVAGGFAGWRWVQSQVFVGASQGYVAIFDGLPQDVGPLSLSTVREIAVDVKVADLPDYARNAVAKGITADDETKAREIVQRYRVLALSCHKVVPVPIASPSPVQTPPSAPPLTSPSATSSGSPRPAVSGSASGSRAATPTTSPTLVPTQASPSQPSTSAPNPNGAGLDCSGAGA